MNVRAQMQSPSGFFRPRKGMVHFPGEIGYNFADVKNCLRLLYCPRKSLRAAEGGEAIFTSHFED
ncbi:MAG: hypothetical protein N2556_07880, partial [Anaerolineae bacterium]|nr:hypothetical protein [Anaerolineae bacterium]